MDNNLIDRYSQSDLALADDIAKALAGEVYSYNFYQRLAEIAPNARFGEIISNIIQDDINHYNWFLTMTKNMGTAFPKLSKIELPEFFDGHIGTCIEEELNTSKFYQNIAERAINPEIQKCFMCASYNDQRHASWLQYMLSQLSTATTQ